MYSKINGEDIFRETQEKIASMEKLYREVKKKDNKVSFLRNSKFFKVRFLYPAFANQ